MKYRNVNFYKVLGIHNFSDDNAIQKAYREQAFRHHPDRGGNPEMMKLINEAKAILTREKSQYDAWLDSQLNPQPVKVFEFRMDFYSWADSATSTSTTNSAYWSGN